jgi:hypothetical protein
MKKIFSLLTAVLFVGSMMAESVTFNFATIASTNSWENGVAYTTVTISPVTLTATGGGNNGKYYTSDNTWRFYSGGTMEVTVEGGKVTAVESTPSKTFEIDSNGKAVYTDGGAKAKFTQVVVTYKLDGASEIDATDIELNKSSLTLEQYREERLTATLTPVNATTSVTWEVADPEIAEVVNGLVKALKTGTTTITAKAGESVSASCDLTVTTPTILTCAQAAAYAATLEKNNDLYEGGRYVVEGYAISKNASSGYLWLADDQDAAQGTFEIYQPTNKSEIASVEIGDKIRGIGYITKYNTTYEFASGCVFEVINEPVDLPKIEIWGDWDDFTKHELTPAYNNLTASYTVELTEVKDYQFAFIYEESSFYLPTVKITRAANEAVCDGTSGNATIEADATGEYTFTWTYATNTVTVTYPDLPLPTYTVTFDLGISKNQPTLTEEEGGAGITLPAGPVPVCTEWAFAGWAEAKVASETTAAPDELFKAGTTYHPADNVILYAVYKRVEGADFDGTEGGDFYIYANVGGTNYYAKDFAQKLESTTDINEAVMFTFEKVVEDEVTYFAIKSGDVYLKYGSSTNFGTQADPYKWQPTAGEHGSWRLKASTTLEASTVRSIVYRAGDTNKFAPYGISNINGTEYFDVEIAGGTTYYFSTPSCWATSVDNTDATKKAVKFIQNGQLFIELNGRIYNVQGQKL